MKAINGTWNFTRWLRLGLAVMFLIAATQSGEPVAYVLAALLGVQAIFNVGCCGAACATGERSARDVSGEKEITFEKVE